MTTRVCITCAGIGSRLGSLTQYLNKSLLSVANRPIISHIIEKFEEDTEFVIALGYKGNLIRQFLTIAYPARNFFFVDVFPFEGAESGLGLSLQACKHYLQQPFIFISCDTLVEEEIPMPNCNWMGYAEISNINEYRTIKIESSCVNKIAEKGEGEFPNYKPYIGLAGILDFEKFWNSMSEGKEEAIKVGEVFGLRSLLQKNIKAYNFTWHDTGNKYTLQKTRDIYLKKDEPNILEKENESIWFVNNNVIKFSDDQKFISNRVKRAQYLKEYVPEILKAERHMYLYNKVQGKVISEIATIPLFQKLLDHSINFWQLENLNPRKIIKFNDVCLLFYRDKTYERVNQFNKKFNHVDDTELINDKKTEKLEKLLYSIDWLELSKGIPCRFHGDFHFENIIWNADNEKFTFLDWRQDFCGELKIGDLYYDLAKLMHGLIINHEIIAKELYNIKWEKKKVNYDFLRKSILVDCENHFKEWMVINGFDIDKVYLLTALIFLNIAALHHYPYSHLLYILGKDLLNNTINHDKNTKC